MRRFSSSQKGTLYLSRAASCISCKSKRCTERQAARRCDSAGAQLRRVFSLAPFHCSHTRSPACLAADHRQRGVARLHLRVHIAEAVVCCFTRGQQSEARTRRTCTPRSCTQQGRCRQGSPLLLRRRPLPEAHCRHHRQSRRQRPPPPPRLPPPLSLPMLPGVPVAAAAAASGPGAA